jgi:hypothetical protein
MRIHLFGHNYIVDSSIKYLSYHMILFIFYVLSYLRPIISLYLLSIYPIVVFSNINYDTSHLYNLLHSPSWCIYYSTYTSLNSILIFPIITISISIHYIKINNTNRSSAHIHSKLIFSTINSLFSYNLFMLININDVSYNIKQHNNNNE